MKKILAINSFALCLPFLMAFLSVFDEAFFYFTIYSVVVTGCIQTVLALVWLIKFKKITHLYIYLFLASIFLILIILRIEKAWYLVPLLVIYFTAILHITHKNNQP